MTLPSFDKLAAHYDKGDPKAFKKRIGGDLTAAWLGENTCVMRVSEALNYAGREARIKKGHGMEVVAGGDGLLYGYNVRQFKQYLYNLYGSASITKVSEHHISADDFKGKRGIIGFDVIGWSDATGHFSLWDGYQVLYQGDHDYFNFPQRRMPHTASLDKVRLWICPG